METFIVDASVGVKWFFNEELSDAARTLIPRLEKREIRVVVPEIFYVELANAFWKRVRKKESTEKDVIDTFESLMRFSLERYSDHELSDVTLENALHFGLTVYDALYLSLAEIYGAPLVTADEVLIKACKNRFDFILPLEEIKD